MVHRAVLAALAAATLAAPATGAAMPIEAGAGLRRQLRQADESSAAEDLTAACAADLEQVVSEQPQLSGFAAAAAAAGFDAAALANSDPETIFAPTNAAFAAVAGPDAFDVLSADTDTLIAIIQGHVVSGLLNLADLADGESLTTLSGTELTVYVTADGGHVSADGGVILVGPNGAAAAVAETDIVVCGRILYSISAVLLTQEQAASLPGDAPCGPQVFAQENPEASTLVAAGFAVTFDDDIAALGPPVTIFAPTNAAFEAVAGPDALAALSGDEDFLREILQGHLVDDSLLAEDLTDGQVLTTAAGTELTVAFTADGGVAIVAPDGTVASVTKADNSICSSVAHIIDAVLLTPQQAARLDVDEEPLPPGPMPVSMVPGGYGPVERNGGTYGGGGKPPGGYGDDGNDLPSRVDVDDNDADQRHGAKGGSDN